MEISRQVVEDAVRSLVVAEEVNVGIEVSTPVAYPGGDMVSVVIDQSAGGISVHDSGAAAIRLTESGIGITKHVASRLAEYASRFNCSFEGNRVSAKTSIATLEFAIAMVANASRSVADYALEIRRHAEADFRMVVSDALREIIGKRLRENEELRGKSGRKYRVSAVILDSAEVSVERFIVPIANRASVPHGFAMMYDLHQQFGGIQNDSIYDESSDIRTEDRELLGSVGQVFSFMEAKHKFRQFMGVVAGHG